MESSLINVCQYLGECTDERLQVGQMTRFAQGKTRLAPGASGDFFVDDIVPEN